MSQMLKQFNIRPNEELRLKRQANLLPRYVHDCDQCIYLGRSEMQNFDLYYCSQQNAITTTVIARYGDEGREYKSGLCFVGVDPELTQAYKLAQLRGLV